MPLLLTSCGTVPLSPKCQGSSAHVILFVFRVPTSKCSPLAFPPQTYPAWGFFPHRDIITGYPLIRRHPASAMVRPQAFSASRRVTPPNNFAGLFHPTATSRVIWPFKEFPLRAAPPDLSPGASPISLSGFQLTDRNLLPSLPALDFEASFHTKVRAVGLVLSAPPVDSLFGFSLLQVLSLRTLGAGSPVPPLMNFPA